MEAGIPSGTRVSRAIRASASLSITGWMKHPGAWAFEPTESAEDARRLAKSFHSGGGFDGELGDDDPAAVYVYIYLKTKDTKQ